MHPVADASKEDVWRGGLELNLPAYCGEDTVGVFDVQHVLKFVKDDAEAVLASEDGHHIEDVFERIVRG